MWRLWAKALGEKATKNDREADYVAGIRTFLFATYLLTNCFIIAGVIRHWNDETHVYVEIHQENPVPPLLQTTLNRTGQFE
jgi:hypothetical protein